MVLSYSCRGHKSVYTGQGTFLHGENLSQRLLSSPTPETGCLHTIWMDCRILGQLQRRRRSNPSGPPSRSTPTIPADGDCRPGEHLSGIDSARGKFAETWLSHPRSPRPAFDQGVLVREPRSRRCGSRRVPMWGTLLLLRSTSGRRPLSGRMCPSGRNFADP